MILKKVKNMDIFFNEENVETTILYITKYKVKVITF